MKIIKQLSEDEFVLKMEEHDLKEMTSVKIAHDYVQIGANVGIQVENGDWKPYGKFATCASNWIKGYFDIQINIRKFIKVILPLFKRHKYCQEKHLLQEDRKPAYNWETEPFTCKDIDDNWYVVDITWTEYTLYGEATKISNNNFDNY